MAKAIYRTYRPKTFKEVSGQEHVVKTIQNQHASDSIAHAYLFTGPRGVGKTTVARLLAKLVNCQSPKKNEPCNACDACKQVSAGNALDVFEIDAASHTDVENVRENIIKSVRFAPNVLNKKVYIIDEVHMLSISSFNALLKTLEEPPDHALFILATTEIHKVPDTIISRCQRFNFKRIDAQVLIKRLQMITKAEGVEVDEAVLAEIVRHSDGCARDAESLLGQVLALGEKKIGIDQASLVLPITNLVQVEAFIDKIEVLDARGAVELLNQVIEQGIDLKYFVSDVISSFRDKLLEAVSSGEDTELLEAAIYELLKAMGSIRLSHIPQLPIELAIVKICRSAKTEQVDFKKREVGSSRPDESLLEQSKPEAHKISTESKGETSSESGSDSLSASKEKKTEIPKKVFDSVPVISIEEVKAKWPEVYEQIKECNASLPLMMKTCEVCGVEGDRVDLAFDYDLYVQTVNKERNRNLVEDVLEKVMGRRLRIRAVHSGGPKNDKVVQNLLEEFGGSVV